MLRFLTEFAAVFFVLIALAAIGTRFNRSGG